MTDVSDQATNREEQERERCINAVSRQNQALQPTGSCYWCEEAVEGERRFCDSDCRDMWQKQDAARKRAGA